MHFITEYRLRCACGRGVDPGGHADGQRPRGP